MKYLKKIGGVRIKNFNATWPLVRLSVEPDFIVINILLYKKILIPKSNILEIYEYNLLSLFAKGIIIKLKDDVNFGSIILKTNKIIFWYFGDTSELVKETKDIMNL